MIEKQNIEFKCTWRDEYLKWICGYANAEGGVLYIGKDDAGVSTGVSNSKKLLEDIPNKVRDILGIIVDVNLYSESTGEHLEIVVESYPYPVSYKGQYHYRSGSTKQELKGAALDRFLLKKQGKHWDGVPVPYVTVDDLETQIIDSFRKRALTSKRLSSEVLNESDKLLLEKLHLFEGEYLKRAAVLFFHPEPEEYVTGAYIKIGFFKSNSDLLYQDEIHGNLTLQVEKAIDLLTTKYMRALISYDGIQRVETFPVPEDAIREVLLNAVVHKDYASSIPIQISVYEDKIMFWNPGVLPDGWTIKTLVEKHSSQPFNPDIANAFFRSGKIEAWGRGIERIMDSCKTAKVDVPEFRQEKTGLWVEFSFPQENTQENTQEKIIVLIKSNPKITRKDLANQIGVSNDSIKHHLKKLKEAKIIRHVGSTKAGYWKVLKDSIIK